MKVRVFIVMMFIIASPFITKAQYTNLFNFDFTTDGKSPFGSLLSDGTFLYGMTSFGGPSANGIIFKIKPDGALFDTLFNFSGGNGANPCGSLIYDGTFLYGMTYGGGTTGNGVVFKIKPDGTNFFKILDFNGINGANPSGSLIFDGTFLYGMTFYGGTSGAGVLFKIMPDGTGYNKLLDFSGTVNGATPNGDLISDGTFLYGMTYQGGTYNKGVLFKVKPDGTGYNKLLDFSGLDGSNPEGSLVSYGTFLYGMTSWGGANSRGTIFKIMPDGSGYSKLLDLNDVINGTNPYGNLIYDSTFLYGMTLYGGLYGAGAIFKIKFDGTGYSTLYDFIGTPNGSNPEGSLISDGTCLYGMTLGGGIIDISGNNDGAIFKYCLSTEIEENNLQTNFSIYPNPTSGIFNLKINEFQNLKIKELKVYNVFSECVYQLTNQQINSYPDLQVDLSPQHNGIYFITIKSEKGTATKKVVIQK